MIFPSFCPTPDLDEIWGAFSLASTFAFIRKVYCAATHLTSFFLHCVVRARSSTEVFDASPPSAGTHEPYPIVLLGSIK